MATPSDPALDRQLDLLRVVCGVAWADGDVSVAEKELLEQVVSQYFPEDAGDAGPMHSAARQLAAWTQDLEGLDAVMARLTHEEDRRLAVKLSYMMARIDRRPEDSSNINADEKQIYRRVVALSGLSETQVEEAEWAADQDLAERRSPWAVLTGVFAGLGAWPTPELLETPGIGWL